LVDRQLFMVPARGRIVKAFSLLGLLGLLGLSGLSGLLGSLGALGAFRLFSLIGLTGPFHLSGSFRWSSLFRH